MAWQFSSQQPIYVQIVDVIERRIFSGSYEMGVRLPSVRDLALEAAVNPNTMQRALSELEDKRLITTQRNSGKTVTDDADVITAARAAKADGLADGYLTDMAALGYQKGAAVEFLTKKEDKDGKHLDNASAD